MNVEMNKKSNGLLNSLYSRFFVDDENKSEPKINEVELAKCLNISIRSVLNNVANGMPCIKGTGHYLFDYSEALDWFNSHTDKLENFAPESVYLAITEGKEVKAIDIETCNKVFRCLKPNCIWEIMFPDNYKESKELEKMLNQVGFVTSSTTEFGKGILAQKIIRES